MRASKLALSLIILSAIVVAIYFFFEARDSFELKSEQGVDDKPPYFTEGVVAAEAASVEDEITCSRNNAIVKAIQKAGPSVVSVSTVQVQVVRDPWFELFYPFSRGLERKRYGLGSGFIFDKRGYLLTNQHVIEGADEIKVTLTSGKEFEAKVAGADYESDLAVLKIDADVDLSIAELGDSSDLMVGEWAIAIGSPFGFLLEDSQPTVTVGIVSTIGRSIQQEDRAFKSLIQTDASINPGNSGGPLVNCYGQVIAINTAIFSTSGGSQGVGFAIPINAAKRVIAELIKHGMVTERWIGIEYQELNEDIAQHLGSPVSEGLLISDIIDGSSAQKAGLMRGDIVFKIGDQPVRTPDEANETIQALTDDLEVIFHIVRDGEFQDIPVNMANAVAETAKAWFGLVVQVPTPEAARKYGLSSYKRGVLLVQVDRDSVAAETGLRRGDLILRMSRIRTSVLRRSSTDVDVEIKTIGDFRKFVAGVRKGQRIRIVFERRGELWQAFLNTAED
jgi:serine protease Do